MKQFEVGPSVVVRRIDSCCDAQAVVVVVDWATLFVSAKMKKDIKKTVKNEI